MRPEVFPPQVTLRARPLPVLLASSVPSSDIQPACQPSGVRALVQSSGVPAACGESPPPVPEPAPCLPRRLLGSRRHRSLKTDEFGILEGAILQAINPMMNPELD